jgi:hypothetical protein
MLYMQSVKKVECKKFFIAAGSTCAPHEFACNNGYCISQEGRCDWFDDCGDSSDERGCGGEQIIIHLQFIQLCNANEGYTVYCNIT